MTIFGLPRDAAGKIDWTAIAVSGAMTVGTSMLTIWLYDQVRQDDE